MRSMVEGFVLVSEDPSTAFGGPPPHELVGRMFLARRIALAAVAGPHGIKGELRLKLFSDSAASLARHDILFVGGVERRLVALREAGKAAIASFDAATGDVVHSGRWVEQATEDRGRVEPRYAPPVDRAVPADQRG